MYCIIYVLYIQVINKDFITKYVEVDTIGYYHTYK